VSPAQGAALRRAAAATGPVSIPAVTARVLGEQFGYIEADGDGWVLTPRGRAHLASERAREKRALVESQLTRTDRRHGERVAAWLRAHKRFHDDEPSSYTVYRYAEHVAACDHAGIEPVATGRWDDSSRVWVEQTVRSAAECLRDFDEALRLAEERGVGVSVDYAADEKVPRSRREAATAAAEANIVSLGKYRERRPGPGAA
jgi:hypothetical protein